MPQSNEEKPPKKCPLCGWAIMEFKGVSARTRRPYHFWGCSNPQCRWVWRKPSKAELRHKEVMKALRIIYKKISALEKLIKENEQNRKESIPIVEERPLSGGETSEGEVA